MSLAIRLTRKGAKKRPFYRIVVADSRKPRDGRFIENLGTYDPLMNKDDPKRITLKKERIEYWLSVGAKSSRRVNQFLANEGMAEKLPIPKQTKKHLPKEKKKTEAAPDAKAAEAAPDAKAAEAAPDAKAAEAAPDAKAAEAAPDAKTTTKEEIKDKPKS